MGLFVTPVKQSYYRTVCKKVSWPLQRRTCAHVWLLCTLLCSWLEKGTVRVTCTTMCRKRYQPWRSSWTSKLTIKLSRLSSHVEVKACLHGGKEPRVGEATRLGGVARLYLVSLILPWSRLHDRWNNPPRRVSRSAGLGYPVSRGHNLPNVNVSRWGDPISRGRIHVTFASAPTTSRNLTKESRGCKIVCKRVLSAVTLRLRTGFFYVWKFFVALPHYLRIRWECRLRSSVDSFQSSCYL